MENVVADRKTPEIDRKVPEAEPVVEIDRKVAEMSDETHAALGRSYPVLIPTVNSLLTGGKTRNQAWPIAGGLLGYTGNVAIPFMILKASGVARDLYPKPALVNDALRGNIPADVGTRALVTLLENIALLPDIDDSDIDPTRMMDAYPYIDAQYAVGNVLIMAEVGSVSRAKPDSSTMLYKRKYRLHFKGGLKDVTLLNPAQQEVIYAPGAMYHVESIRDGTVMAKKGNQAHRHIHLRHVTRASPEFMHASVTGGVVDLRTAAFQH